MLVKSPGWDTLDGAYYGFLDENDSLISTYKIEKDNMSFYDYYPPNLKIKVLPNNKFMIFSHHPDEAKFDFFTIF